jgi:transposase
MPNFICKTCGTQYAEGGQPPGIALLTKLRAHYPRAAVIHVILDNYRIHDSKITQAALLAMAGRIRLHFLPPYCPQHNKIERTWEDLHAEVTRNHTCRTVESLLVEETT